MLVVHVKGVPRHDGRVFASSTRSAGAPGGQPAPSEVGTRRILTIGAIAGGWAAVAGLACVAVLVLVAWLAGGMREDVSDALALAVHGWLLGLGPPWRCRVASSR